MASRDVPRLEHQVDAVMEASRAMVALVAASHADDDRSLTLPQWRVLAILNQHGPSSLKAVARWMGVHPSTATRACDALVNAGLVDRREDSHDRRRLVLSLTVQGRRLVDSLLARRREAIARVLRHVPSERRNRVAEAMQEFADAAEHATQARGASDGSA